MEAITKITLDMLHPRNRVVVHAKQLDSQTRTIQATLLCDGLVYDIPSGAVATFSARKPSDTAVWEAATINGSTVSYTLTQNELAVAGYMMADFQLWQGNDRLSTFSFLIDVEADVVTDQEIEDNSDFTALQELISQFTQVVAQIRDIDYTVLNPNYSLTIYYSDGTSYTTPPIGGTPTVVSTAAGMTDTSRIYVYVGSETGYTAGNWYYHNGSAWVSGGTYNAVAFDTDKSLSVPGMAADGATTGAFRDALGIFGYLTLNIAQGSINSTNGNEAASATRCRTQFLKVPMGGLIIPAVSNLKFYVHGYTTNSASGYLGALSGGWVTSYFVAETAATYVRVVIAYSDDSSITPENCANVVVKTVEYTDTNLGTSGKAADAKATADILSSVLSFGTATATWEQGAISGTTGADGANAKRIRTPASSMYEVGTSLVRVVIPSGFEVMLCWYRSATVSDYAIANAWFSGDVVFYPRARFMRMVLRNTSDSNIVPSDVTSNIVINYYVPKVQPIIAPTGTDQTVALTRLLSPNGSIELSDGTFIVHELNMPEGSMIKGQGNGTIIQLNTEYASTYAIKMVAGCKIENVKIIGAGGVSWSVDGTITNSHGILINTSGTGDSNRNRITLTNLEICGFSGGAITLDGTGYNYDDSVNVVNIFAHNNNVGINIPNQSEYNKFTNCQIGRNYYGCINNGGNNMFVNCGFNGNVQGLLMDNSSGTKVNNSHGSFVGCTFNHNNSNTGKAVEIIGMESGEVFSGCQFFYGTIHLTNSNGVLLSGCNFGNSTGIYCNGGANLMVGCMQKSRAETPITLTNGAIFHVVNCYSRSGAHYNDFA